jgi:uncharacterized membrane-anchored protein
MKNPIIKIAALLITAWTLAMPARAQDDTNDIPPQALKILKSLKYQQGTIDLHNGLATLNVPKEFNYLSPDDAEKVLVQLWHNPPESAKTLGLLIPAGMTPISSNAWVVTIEYSEDGYVKDDDAAKINYDDLLKQMQKGVEEANKARQEKGYEPIKLVGWAAPPRYDAATHKLYWAKQIKFGDDATDTLNYNIRMLGRKGVLELTAVASVDQFQEIDKQTPQILSMVDFKEGSRYADFDPKVDKVATYGLAALVAGGVAAKLGFFKLLWVGILALKKFVIIGLVAVGAFIKRLFGRKDGSGPTA